MGKVNNDLKHNADSFSIAGPTKTIDITVPLYTRIESIYKDSGERIRRIETERDAVLRTLLEGFLAAIPGTEGKNFDLSADMRQLIEK